MAISRYDFDNYGSSMEEYMRRQQAGALMPQQYQEPPPLAEEPKPKKPSHLNTKLLLTKGA